MTEYQLYGRYTGCNDRWPFLHTFANDEEGRECAFECADEILLGHYDGSGDTEFDHVDIMLGKLLIAQVHWDPARHGQF